MSDFVPEGYLPFTSAVDQALRHWFGEQIAAALNRIMEDLTKAGANHSSANPLPSHLEKFIKQKLADACREQIDQTHRDLRNALHIGALTALYFSTTPPRDEPSAIPRAFWTSPEAADVIKDGVYFPLGLPHPRFRHPQFVPPKEQLLVREEELRRFLSGETSTPDAEAGQTAKASMIAPAAERYLTPYIDLMLQAIDCFAISATRWPKKEDLLMWFLTQKLPDGTPITKNQAEMMATFARPPDASRGGNKRI